jgi:hypothetical protein
MKRLDPTLAALAIAVAATMVWPSTGSAILMGDELVCAEETAERGVGYAATILPKIQDDCIEDANGFCDPAAAGIAEDHDEFAAGIEEDCEDAPDSFEGFCGDEDDVADIAECVADAYDAGATMVADLSVGGGMPPPRVVVIPIKKVQMCSSVGGPCFGQGITGCCTGLICRAVASEVDGELTFSQICVPRPTPTPGDGCEPYCSATRAFIDPARSLLE